MMIILKRYIGSIAELKKDGLPTDWFETTDEECIKHTESAGYWRKNTVLNMLANGEVIKTPFAHYKKFSLRDGTVVK